MITMLINDYLTFSYNLSAFAGNGHDSLFTGPSNIPGSSGIISPLFEKRRNYVLKWGFRKTSPYRKYFGLRKTFLKELQLSMALELQRSCYCEAILRMHFC